MNHIYNNHNNTTAQFSLCIPFRVLNTDFKPGDLTAFVQRPKSFFVIFWILRLFFLLTAEQTKQCCL